MLSPQNVTLRTLRHFRGLRSSRSRCLRSYATASEPDLKTVLKEVIPEKRELLAKAKQQADVAVGEVTVGSILGGMRGVRSLVWEGSVLDPQEGIRFHGRTIDACRTDLPKGKTGSEMLPEAMFWLLLTGRVPSENQVRGLSHQLATKNRLGPTANVINGLNRTLHPMAQLSVGITAMSETSTFAKAYTSGISKAEYWEYVFDDCISLIAKLPKLAAFIYNRTYKPANPKHYAAIDQDWAHGYAAMLGKGGPEHENFQDLLRLYLALHADHEGGNVSAHATHLVGSALSDPFLSYSAGLQGLAGPLHGLAAQEVVRFVQEMMKALPESLAEGAIADLLRKTLNSGRVIPGYGHGVLRQPDPRFEALMAFGVSRPEVANDPQFQLVQKLSKIAPEVLKEHGKTKNPYPNVDAVSGVLFHHFGITETLYYTAIFGVSRALGCLSQLIWSRILGLPIERPKSIDLKGVIELADSRTS